MKQLIKRFLKQSIREFLYGRVSRAYSKQYRQQLKINNIPNRPVQGEAEWIKKWSVLGKANPIYYRLFSHYIGHNINIIPEDICRNVVEPILDPERYVPYYSDKNIFDKLFKKGTMPNTLFRKIGGSFYDATYNKIEIEDDQKLKILLNSTGFEKIVIKPSVDSCSGNGVKLFEKRETNWVEVGGEDPLSVEFLAQNYGKDYIVQECLKQVDYMAYYNPSSVNTLRLTLYRSVKDNECYVPSAIIRIGAHGSLVDNAHAGGAYVGIKRDGTLCNEALNQYGETIVNFNGLDLSKEHKLPSWDKIIEFAKYIGQNVPHHRLLALDIMIDDKNKPRLVEFNCDSYSMWLFQFTMGSAFGEFTDEIIEYCKSNLDKAERLLRI